MKSIRYIAVSLFLLMVVSSYACGPDLAEAGKVLLYRIMPIDETTYSNYEDTWSSDFYLQRGLPVNYEEEMTALWKLQTSKDISSEDIKYVVYKANVNYLQNIKKKEYGKNSFAKWLVANGRYDIADYLILAKQCEEVVFSMADPWYYGVDGDKQSQMLEDIIARCKSYKKGPLMGRYTLQLLRALFAQRKYKECVDVWNERKNLLADDAVRKIAELKAASAMNKSGNKQDALKIYATYGDISSIRTVNGGSIENELEYVYNLQPNSPYLIGELQKWLIYFGDDWYKNGGWLNYVPNKRISDIIKVAQKAVKNQKTKNKAMWYYTLAALYDVKGQQGKAITYLSQGEKCRKSPFLKDSYRVLRMWLEAQTAAYNDSYEKKLFADVKWLVAKIENNVPQGFRQKMDCPPRTHVSPYFDDFIDLDCSPNYGYLDYPNSFYWNDAMRRILLREVCPRMHKAKKYVREVQLANLAENLLIQINDYSNEMFQIMDRQSYLQTKEYFNRIYHPKDDFDVFLNHKGKVTKYYWYDILATKCMREQRYAKATVYLKQIPLQFQKKMNVFDEMNKDPFSYDMVTFKSMPSLAANYKLHFAEKMARYQQMMRHHRNPNKRADAKLMYALGLRNSVNRCWFLTRHSSNWDNSYTMDCMPDIAYASDSAVYRHERYMKLSDKLINQAIATYTDKEKAARQLQKLLYFRRILDHYGDTETARNIRLHCDRWKDYRRVL